MELKGRQNKPPDQKYRGRVKEFLRSRHGGEMPTSEMSELIWMLTREEALGDPEWAYEYARRVDKAPHDDTRAAALGSPWSAYRYAWLVDEAPRDDTRAGRWEIQSGPTSMPGPSTRPPVTTPGLRRWDIQCGPTAMPMASTMPPVTTPGLGRWDLLGRPSGMPGASTRLPGTTPGLRCWRSKVGLQLCPWRRQCPP